MSNILLINDNVQDYQTIINACNDNTYPITYNQGTDTYDSIFAKYENMISENNIQIVNHLALVSHGSNNPEFTFLEKENKMLISQYLPDLSNCASCQTNETQDNDLSLNDIDELFDNTLDVYKYIVDLSLNLTQEDFDTKEIYTCEEILSIFKDVFCNLLIPLYDLLPSDNIYYGKPTIHYLIMESYYYKIRDTSENQTLINTETDTETYTDTFSDNYKNSVILVLTREAISNTTSNTRNNSGIISNYSPTNIKDVSTGSSMKVRNRYILNNLDSWNVFKEFIKKFNIQNSLDFLGCALLQSNNWKYTLSMLETQYHLNLNIRASDDNTGNLKIGSDWVLESDNVNIKELYFNGESIEKWEYNLSQETKLSTIRTIYNNINSPPALTETKLSDLTGVEYIKQMAVSVVWDEFLYTSPGSHTWTCPAGVTSVCVVCCGGGGGGIYYNSSSSGHTYAMNGGCGGGLGWENNISVTPGLSYNVVVGAGGSAGAFSTGSTDGGDSYFHSLTTVMGGGGQAGRYSQTRNGGGHFPTGQGGNGGSAYNTQSSGKGPAGGGGAGGYTGNGGEGNQNNGNGSIQGSGGGGAGGTCTDNKRSSGGGGVGPYGKGTSGSISSEGGSGGGDGGPAGSSTALGGSYGGGGGGNSSIYWGQSGNGSSGFVRIIWGGGRSFPSTNTHNQTGPVVIQQFVTLSIPSTDITFSTLNNLINSSIVDMKPTMTITAIGSGGSSIPDGFSSNDTYLDVTFTSTEPTSDFVQSDITVYNGTISQFNSTSSTVYTARFTPDSFIAGTAHSIDVLQGAYTNNKTTIGCQNNAATQFNWTWVNAVYEFGHKNTGSHSIAGALSGATVSPSGYTLTSQYSVNVGWQNYSMGSRFTINTSGKIVALGAQNVYGGKIGIWLDGATNATLGNQNPIATVDVAGTGNNSSTSINMKYTTLNPAINVSAGQSYRIAFKNNSGGYAYNLRPNAELNTNTTSGNLRLEGVVYTWENSGSLNPSWPHYASTGTAIYGATDIIFTP